MHLAEREVMDLDDAMDGWNLQVMQAEVTESRIMPYVNLNVVGELNRGHVSDEVNRKAWVWFWKA